MVVDKNLCIGNQIVNLEEIDSTNLYAKRLLCEGNNVIEGLCIVAKNQKKGRGQQGNIWLSESDKNLTFSLVLRPKIVVKEQFMLSKIISLAIVDFLTDLTIKNVKIKWPNDIYVNDFKIAGILMENLLKGQKIEHTIVGIGLNVNQVKFAKELLNPIALKMIMGKTFNLDELLIKILFFIERRYLMLKNLQYSAIDKAYINCLYRLNELHSFNIKGKMVMAKIVGITKIGKLKLNINNLINDFDLKEVKFIF